MLLPHSFLKYFQSAQKEVKIASNCFFVRLNTLKHTTLREVMVNSLYSKPTFFQKERMDKDHLLDVGDISEFKQIMPEFLSELGEQVLLMREKREILDFTDKLKEQSLRLQTAKGKYLCDITFVFFEEKDMFHVYLSVNSKEVEEQNFDKKVFIPRNYRERLKGSVFTNEAKIKSFRFLPLILNNYNFGTKLLEEVKINDYYTIDHEWFKDMIVAPLLKFAKKPSLFLGEFKTEEVRKVYEKLFSIYENKEIQANKEVSFGLVLEEFTKHFNLNRNALRLFELCYLLGNSKTIYDRQLNKPIIFTDRKVTNNEDKIAKLLEDNNKLEALEKALYQINDSYQLRDNVRDKIKENLNLINLLSIKEEDEKDETDNFEEFISSLENKVKKEKEDYGFLNLLLILRMMNIIKFS